MKLNLQMLSKIIISLPVEKEHNHFTSAEFFNKILILWYENKLVFVLIWVFVFEYFSGAV